jgi:phospholipid transport system substrate-binding protein
MRCMKNLLLILLMLSLWEFPAYGAAPMAQVQITVDQVLEVLRSGQLQGPQRRETLSHLIRARFDFVIMSQRTLGKNWKSATAAEQNRFVSLFSDLLESSYIGRIEAYNDQSVRYLAEQVDGGRAEVTTEIYGSGPDIPISYRLVLKGDNWFIYDVVVEEISLINNYRSTYGELIRKEGFDGLFGRMEKKIVELKTSPEGATGQ